MIRSVTTREPEWDDQEQGKALALADYESQLCPGGCGGFLTETTDPDTKWETSPPHRCFKCDAIAKRQEQYINPDPKRGTPSPRPQALIGWPVWKKT